MLMEFFLNLLMSIKHLPLLILELEDPINFPVLDHRFVEERSISLPLF